MRIRKYNRANAASRTAATIQSTQSATSSVIETEQILNRRIWGNQDDGGDIDDTIHASGSVYAHKGTDSDTYPEDPEDEGGSIFAEDKVKGPTISATEKMLLPYPNAKSPQVDLATTIASLANRIALLEQNGGSGGTTGGGGSQSPSDAPEILVAGYISRGTNPDMPNFGKWSFVGYKHPAISDISIYTRGGLMGVDLVSLKLPQVFSVAVMQRMSGATESLDYEWLEDPGVFGGHWFEARAANAQTPEFNTTVWIREFHIDGEDIEWESTDWEADRGVNSIQFTVIGVIFEPD